MLDMIDIEKIKEITDKYNIVTFDVFDTLIIRDVNKPTLVFKKSYGLWGRYIRIFSEFLARKFSGSSEVALKDIQKFCPFNLSKEIRIEYELCRANPQMYAVYDSLTKEGKTVYAISDMYLESNIIQQILKKSGYDVSLLVSCDYGKSKRDGTLFKLFLEQFKYDAKDVIHIGDNINSDIEGAKKAGIESILVNKHENVLAYTK